MRNLSKFTFLIVSLILNSCQESITVSSVKENQKIIDWNNEIIYHVMQRSFFDSNGDLHGDLNGFVNKLDYLKELGITTILFTPLYESDFYHNYFPTNYENIDPEYGTIKDYINFIKEVHNHDLKFLMDMETQYSSSGNIWFDDSYKNPKSRYSNFIYYSDSLNQFPEQIFMEPRSPLQDFNLWPDKKRNIVLLDLNNKKVKDFMMDFYSFWVDPNQDGKFDDGVDGFRIDHIMDDLDYKGIFTNMYTEFWEPIFQKCKSINSNIFLLGEQSNWNQDGKEMVVKSGADAAFSFPLRFALAGQDGVHDIYADLDKRGFVMIPKRIHKVVLKSMSRFKDTIFTVNFLENHDIDRWASVVNNNPGQLRIGAILNLLLPGVPSIYYGQELGLTGVKEEYGSDANHILIREAFPWTSDPSDSGNAIWYKETGPWWKNSLWNSAAIQNLSLNTQQNDSNSLWFHYKKIIEIRKKLNSLGLNSYEPIFIENENILAFKRTNKIESLIVILNVSDNNVTIQNCKLDEIIYKNNSVIHKNNLCLKSFGYVIELSKKTL